MISKHEIWKKMKDNGFDETTICLLMTIVVIICFCMSMRVTPFSNYPTNTSSQRINRALMRQSLNNISMDRIKRHQSRLPVTPTTQSIAQSEGREAYGLIPSKLRKSYQMHMLYTNDYREKTPITRELIKASKNVKGISYHSNITTISFGNRHYTKVQEQWHPWHRISTPHAMANIINKRMMQNTRNNSHRKNILNKNNQSVGVYAKYDKKLNRGILVETFRKKE